MMMMMMRRRSRMGMVMMIICRCSKKEIMKEIRLPFVDQLKSVAQRSNLTMQGVMRMKMIKTVMTRLKVMRTLMTMVMQVRLASHRFYSTTDESNCPIMDILLHTAWIRWQWWWWWWWWRQWWWWWQWCLVRRKQTGWLTTWLAFTGGWRETPLKASSVSGHHCHYHDYHLLYHHIHSHYPDVDGDVDGVSGEQYILGRRSRAGRQDQSLSSGNSYSHHHHLRHNCDHHHCHCCFFRFYSFLFSSLANVLHQSLEPEDAAKVFIFSPRFFTFKVSLMRCFMFLYAGAGGGCWPWSNRISRAPWSWWLWLWGGKQERWRRWWRCYNRWVTTPWATYTLCLCSSTSPLPASTTPSGFYHQLFAFIITFNNLFSPRITPDLPWVEKRKAAVKVNFVELFDWLKCLHLRGRPSSLRLYLTCVFFLQCHQKLEQGLERQHTKLQKTLEELRDYQKQHEKWASMNSKVILTIPIINFLILLLIIITINIQHINIYEDINFR